MEYSVYVLISGVLALVAALLFAIGIIRKDAGNKKMQEIAHAIHHGALAFLFREYKVMAIFAIVVFFILGFFLNWVIALSFIIGAFLSVLSGFIGMYVATKANVRTTQAATKSLAKALRIAFGSGAVMGLYVVGLGVIGITVLYLIFKDPNLIIGFSFGASSVALFARVGGGIFTKAADVGADLVGKVESGIPEDDPRNPAVIADNVGDNVGDVAGMGADLFESYVGSIIATMILGLVITTEASKFVMLPLLIAGVGIIASIIGTLFVRTDNEKKIHNAINNGLLAASILLIPCVFFIIKYLMPQTFTMYGVTYLSLGIFYACIAGLVAGVAIGFITEYYTSSDYRPTKGISESSTTGAATTVIEGLSVGMMSTVLPMIVICIAIYIAYYFAGLYGIAISAV